MFDGAGDVVPDAMVETWQADPDGGFPSPEDPRGAASYPGFRGYARAQTIDAASSRSSPSSPAGCPTARAACRRRTSTSRVFARGILDRVVTRIYFADEAEANAEDVVLRGAARRPARGR